MIWLTIFGMAIVTYGTRLLPLTTINSDNLPLWAKRSLTYVPIVVLSAIIGPEFLPHKEFGHFEIKPQLVAGIFAVGTAYVSKNTIVTILVGIIVLIVLNEIV